MTDDKRLLIISRATLKLILEVEELQKENKELREEITLLKDIIEEWDNGNE